MPIWIANFMFVTGDDERRARLREKMTGPAGGLERLDAMLELLGGDDPRTRETLTRSLESTNAASFTGHVADPAPDPENTPNWHQLRMDAWGTPWNAMSSSVGPSSDLSDHPSQEQQDMYSFFTVERPPDRWFAAVCDQERELHLRLLTFNDSTGDFVGLYGNKPESGEMTFSLDMSDI